MNKHNVPTVVAQSIIINVSTNENDKSLEIWRRLNGQFGNESLSRSQICTNLQMTQVFFKLALKIVKQGDPVWNNAQKFKLLPIKKKLSKFPKLILLGIYGVS